MQEDVSHYASPLTGRALTMAQRKKGRRAYLDSFHQTPSGDYIYTGATYSLANGSGRTAVRLAVLGAAAVVAEAAAGCFSAPGTGRCFYILLPYAAALIACVLAAWAAVRLAAGGVRLRQYVYDGTVKKLPRRTLAAAVLAGAAALGETVYLLLHGPEGLALGAAAYLLCQLGAAAAMLALRGAVLGLEYREER